MTRIFREVLTVSRSSMVLSSRRPASNPAERAIARSPFRSDLECLRVAAGMALIALVTAAALTGQSFYGSIRGTVVDPNAGIIPNAKVMP